MPAGVSFVENLTGGVSRCTPIRLPDWADDPDGYDVAVRRAAASALNGTQRFGLYGLALDVRPTPGADDGLPGVVRGGTIRHGGRDYQVTDGRFVALAAAARGGRRLRYRVRAESRTGERVEVAGVKWVTGRPWRWWPDTSRLYVVVSVAAGEPTVAAGVVRLGAWSFIRQLGTLRGRPGDVLTFLWRFTARLVFPTAPRPRTGQDADPPS